MVITPWEQTFVWQALTESPESTCLGLKVSSRVRGLMLDLALGFQVPAGPTLPEDLISFRLPRKGKY